MAAHSFVRPHHSKHLRCSLVSFRARQYRAVYSPAALAADALACDGFHCLWPARAASALGASGDCPEFVEDARRFLASGPEGGQ